MELRQIRYFVAVAEEENVSAAARRLNVSQPPITRQIQQLEAELDVQLFNRTQKGMELTAAGQAFFEESRKILTRTRLAAERSRAAARGEIGNLEIGYFGSPIYSIVPNFIRIFCQQNKTASVSLQPMSKRDQVEALKDGRIHVGFSRYFSYEAGLEFETVAHEQIVLAVSESHRLAGADAVPVGQLKSEPIIVFPRSGRPSFADEVVRILRKARIEPDIRFEAVDLTPALALTAADMGVCPVPDSVTRLTWPNVKFVPLNGVTAKSPVNCVYRAGEQSPILQKFLETVRACAVEDASTAQTDE